MYYCISLTQTSHVLGLLGSVLKCNPQRSQLLNNMQLQFRQGQLHTTVQLLLYTKMQSSMLAPPHHQVLTLQKAEASSPPHCEGWGWRGASMLD